MASRGLIEVYCGSLQKNTMNDTDEFKRFEYTPPYWWHC